jgi:translocation and assembly module TamB
MHARVDGTPARPDLDGTFQVRDGVVRLAAREEVLEKVRADFRLDETRITLDTLSAVQGERGLVTGNGVVDLDGMALRRYHFDLGLRRFTASESGVYAAEIDGDLRVVNGPRVRGVSLPQVTGRVDVHRAAVLYDFTKQTESDLLAASTKPLFWTYRIDLKADDNLKWTPADADIEFDADLTMEQTRDSLLIYGEMHALRGTYYFLSQRFNVEKADLTFDNVNGVNPMIDAEATTRVTGSCSLAGLEGIAGPSVEDVPHTITVQITGRADEPFVAFSSDPDDWDEPCILRQITLGGALAGNSLEGATNEVSQSFLARAISRTVSPELERAFRGYLNDWRVERDAGGGYRLGVSTQPWQNVNVRYEQRVTGGTSTSTTGLQDPFEQSVQAEYRLGRFLYIATQLVRRGTTSSTSPSEDLNVNLKARWEY